jgi:ketosteroid isomerase-like protein
MKGINIMRKILSFIVIALMSFSAMAGHHEMEDTDLHKAIKAFDDAYSSNDVATYFGFYAADATVFFSGARQDVDVYHAEWIALMEAGGGVEKNDMSDLKVQVMPSGDVAIATSIIDNRTRLADGTTSSETAFETDVWQKIDGEWKIVSLHYSTVAAGE